MRLSNLWLLALIGCFGGPVEAPKEQPSVKAPPPAPPAPPPRTVVAPWFSGMNSHAALEHVDYDAVENPGLILLIVDTLRADALGVYGQPQPTSPYLDQLGRNGVVFTNHVSNSTWTRTSVASLLTGAYPNQHGVLELNRGLKRKHTTLAERLKAAGFATGTVLANPIVGSSYGLTQGYDFSAEPKTHFGDKHPNATEVFKVAKRWLKKQEKQPFFLSVLLFDPHHPYTPSPEMKASFCPDCDRKPIVHPQREYRSRAPTDKQIIDMKGLYHAEVRETDAAIARFFGWLEASGLSERVTVAVVADHGEAFGEHDVFEHAFHPWDEVARTPMILSGAGIRSRGFVDSPTQHVDVLPTFLRLAGQTIPLEAVGLPLVQTAKEPGLSPQRPTLSEVEMYGIHRFSIRHNGLKLVRHEPLNEERFLQYYDTLDVYPSVARRTGRWELFDTVKDPGEHNNLAGPDIGKHPLVKALEDYRANRLPQELNENAPDDALLEDLKALGYIE